MRDINLKRTCYSAWPLFVLLGCVCHTPSKSLTAGVLSAQSSFLLRLFGQLAIRKHTPLSLRETEACFFLQSVVIVKDCQPISTFSATHQMDSSGERDVDQIITGSEKMELPVLTQPGLGVTTTTMTTITQTGGDWSTGLFDVCGDTSTFLMGMFVPCCLDVSLAHQYGECMCLPLLPGSTFAMRVGIRERFKIRGSVCEDWTTVYCCYPLALCQMIREMKKRLKTQTYTVSTMLDSS